jgi:hypothetical protein
MILVAKMLTVSRRETCRGLEAYHFLVLDDSLRERDDHCSTGLFISPCKNKKVRPFGFFYSSLTEVQLGSNLSLTNIKLQSEVRLSMKSSTFLNLV